MDELEKKLWIKVNRYLKFLKIVPFLRLVAVCNNLAFKKVDNGSDIDLFIIAKEGRLFTARILITGILHLLGVRRHGNKIAGRFCLSFFVDDKYLDLSKIAIEQDIYLAYWVKSMLPILDDGISGDFLQANLWAKRFFEEENAFEINLDKVINRKSFLRGIFEWLLNGKFGDLLEKKLKRWQLKRASEKINLASGEASLIVDEHILKFHNIDRRRTYRNKWFKLYGKDAKLNEERFLVL